VFPNVGPYSVYTTLKFLIYKELYIYEISRLRVNRIPHYIAKDKKEWNNISALVRLHNVDRENYTVLTFTFKQCSIIISSERFQVLTAVQLKI
jgi:hypothetical protein